MNFNTLSLEIGSGLFAGQEQSKVGDTVPVMYLPGKPTTATIDRGLCNWEPLGRMTVLGIMLSGLSLVSLRSQDTGEWR